MKKKPAVSVLVTNAPLNAKATGIESKIPKLDKSIAASEFSIFSGTIFDEIFKKTNLVAKSDLKTVIQRNNKNNENSLPW